MKANVVKKYIGDFISLPRNATHDDIKHKLANLLEEVFDSWARSQLPYDTDIPDIVLFDKVTGIDFLVVEVKAGATKSKAELEAKHGARKGENACEQLKRYLETTAIKWGILADISRVELYRYDENRKKLIHEKEIVIEGRSIDQIFNELMEVRELIRKETTPPPKHVSSPIMYAEKLRDRAILLKEAILKLYRELVNYGVDIKEYRLLKEVMPAIITEDDFASKTVTAILAKLTLTYNSELSTRTAVTSPELIREVARNGEVGYLSYYMWIQDYMATKYPQVFKSDVDLFNWWIPYSSRYDSTIRDAVKDTYASLNIRLRTIIDYVMRFKPPKGRDVLGLLYQFIRSKHEQAILGAYYTKYELVKFVFDALEIFVGKAEKKNYVSFGIDDIYLNAQLKILDPACGSGSFLAHFIERALNYGIKRELERSDIASRVKHKIHGIDVDPLAVLTARTELFMLLSQHLASPYHINVYWGDSLKLAEAIKRRKTGTLLRYFLPNSEEYFKEIKAPIREFNRELMNAYNIVKDGVHIIVGNPPWGRRSEVKKKVRDILVRLRHYDPETVAEEYMCKIVSVEDVRAKYFSRRDHNIFVPFIIQISNMLKSGGVLAMLVDARFVASEWGKPFIEFLERNSSFLRVIDVSQENLFIKATSYPALVLLVKR